MILAHGTAREMAAMGTGRRLLVSSINALRVKVGEERLDEMEARAAAGCELFNEFVRLRGEVDKRRTEAEKERARWWDK